MPVELNGLHEGELHMGKQPRCGEGNFREKPGKLEASSTEKTWKGEDRVSVSELLGLGSCGAGAHVWELQEAKIPYLIQGIIIPPITEHGLRVGLPS